MRQLIIVISVLISFSCSSDNNNIEQKRKGTKKKNLERQIDKSEDKLKAINFDQVKKLFFQFANENFQLEKTPVSDRIIESYTLSKPFSLSKSHEVTRVSTKEGDYLVDIIFYTYTSDAYNDALELIKQDSSNGQFIFGKDWDKIFGIDNTLIRINGGCRLSKQNWKNLVFKFFERIDSTYYINWKGYECNCGLPCKKM